MMNFLNDGTYEVEYEKTNRTILDCDVTNMELITSKGDFVHLDDGDD